MKKEKKPFKMPHTFVIMFIIILTVTAMTWLIPAGSYVRVENEAGIKVIDPTQFAFIERSPVNPFLIPMYIVKAICSRVDLILVILFAGGAFHMITQSGALQAAVAKMANVFKDRLYIFIPVMTLAFALICTTQGVNTFIAFAPVVVMITMAMGLDSITGAAIILLGGAVGFSTGTLNINTTVVAQEIAELPLYSGIGYRAVCFVVFLIITNIFLVRYAYKIKKDPTKSPMYDLDLQNDNKNLDINAFGEMDGKKILVLLSLVAALAAIVYGGVALGWDMEETAAVFIALGIVVGFIAGFTPSKISKEFLDGCKKMLGAALIIGLATSIGQIMTAGKIIDTIIYGLAGMLSHVPTFLMGPAMYISNTLINFAIVSGSGQASAVMPIMVPLADLLGISRQTAVLAYNFGDGFCNYILPHSTALMGIISAVNIPYDRWMKFMWKLFLIWALAACVMTSIAQFINYGPM
ncbi:MAG: YfcC family protein [Lachnospiraceae bacterium]